MTIQVYPNYTAPLEGTNRIFSGQSSLGAYVAPTTFNTGSYVVSAFSYEPGSKFQAYAPNSKKIVDIAENGSSVITLTTTESSFQLLQSINATSASTANLSFGSSGSPVSITYGNGLFGVLGTVTGIAAQHQFRSSADGVTWTGAVNTGINTGVSTHILYGNGVWVALNTVLGSTSDNDGVTWTTRSLFFTNNNMDDADRKYCAAFGNGQFLNTGASSANWQVSSDGVTWVTRPTPGFIGRAVTYGNGTWVAASNVGTTIGEVLIATSTDDALTWTTRTSGWSTGRVYSIVYGNGLFVIGGDDFQSQVLTSTDGITWSLRQFPYVGTTNDIVESLVYGGVFVGYISNNKRIYSADGVNWLLSDILQTAIESAAFGNGRYVSIQPTINPEINVVKGGGAYFSTYNATGSSTTLN